MSISDIQRMLEWNERRGEPRPISMLTDSLRKIGKIWEGKAGEAKEFADFIPMRIVTIIEVCVRESIRELVDTGPPYLQRAETLSKGARMDFALLSSLQGRKLSVGDLVAHTVSINEPGRVVAYLEALIPDFMGKLKASHERWTEEEAEWPLEPIIRDYNEMFRQLSRVFSVRHILTHELPRDPAFNNEEIAGFVAASVDFLTGVDWVLVEELKGSVARTQATMNGQAGDNMRELEKQMGDQIAVIEKRGAADNLLLKRSQAAWQAYASAEADLRASLVQGGSMYPLVWASVQSENIRQRIETLRWWLDRDEGDL